MFSTSNNTLLSEIFLAIVETIKYDDSSFNILKAEEIEVKEILLAEPSNFYGYKVSTAITASQRNIYYDEERLLIDFFKFFER